MQIRKLRHREVKSCVQGLTCGDSRIQIQTFGDQSSWSYLPCFSEQKSESVCCSVVSGSLWPHGLYSHGILQARILEWVVFSSLGDLPNPGTEPRSPTLVVQMMPKIMWAARIQNMLVPVWDTYNHRKIIYYVQGAETFWGIKHEWDTGNKVRGNLVLQMESDNPHSTTFCAMWAWGSYLVFLSLFLLFQMEKINSIPQSIRQG